MKRYLFFLSLLLFGTNLYSQTDSIVAIDSVMQGWGSLDYVIPESPAFNMLDNKPANIITPSSVEKLTTEINTATDFGIEISPLLWSKNLNLETYNRSWFYYNSRLSYATATLDNENKQHALGLRFTIIDNTDLNRKINNRYIDSLQTLIMETLKIPVIFHANPDSLHNLLDEIDTQIEKCSEYDLDEQKLNSLQTKKNEILALLDQYNMNEENKISLDSLLSMRYKYTKKIDKYIEKEQKERWNATIWQAGVATMWEGKKNFIDSLNWQKLGLWTTVGFHLGSSKTKFGRSNQILIGARFELLDSLHIDTISLDTVPKIYPKFAIGTRFYYGNNDIRGFLQAQYENVLKTKTNLLTASIGVLLNLYDGVVWLCPTLNFTYDIEERKKHEKITKDCWHTEFLLNLSVKLKNKKK